MTLILFWSHSSNHKGPQKKKNERERRRGVCTSAKAKNACEGRRKKKRGQGQGAGAWRERRWKQNARVGLPTPRIETRGILFSFYSKDKKEQSISRANIEKRHSVRSGPTERNFLLVS